MEPAYISDLINVRKHAGYSLRSNSGTILLHPAGKMKKSLALSALITFLLLNLVYVHI